MRLACKQIKSDSGKGLANDAIFSHARQQTLHYQGICVILRPRILWLWKHSRHFADKRIVTCS